MTLKVNMPQNFFYLHWLSIEGAIWILKPRSLQCLCFKLFKKSASDPQGVNATDRTGE